MRPELENLIKEIKAVKPRPGKKLAAAIKAAELKLEEVDARPELNLLARELKNYNSNLTVQFAESNSVDNRYALTVQTKNSELLRYLARLFGCPIQDYPTRTATSFEAGDRWHGRGRINLRDLADELIRMHGEFFDVEYTVGKLKEFKLRR